MYEAISCNTGDAYGTDAAIIRKLQEACYIWTHGQSAPETEDQATEKKPTLDTWLKSLEK
jgi:hypothetical protein